MNIDFEELEQAIMIRLWRCNELSGKRAEDYAFMAVDELRKHMNPFRPQPTRNTVPTNPATLLAKGEDL